VVGVSGFRKHTGHGTPQQKERFLNPLLNGEKRICFSMTEKAAGADRLNTSSDEMVLHPRIGSLALRFCRVAQGSLDAAFAGGQSHDWDLAAADLIVQEANGTMTTLSGDAILYNRREVSHGVLVAAGSERHASIISHFRSRSLP